MAIIIPCNKFVRNYMWAVYVYPPHLRVINCRDRDCVWVDQGGGTILLEPPDPDSGVSRFVDSGHTQTMAL